MGTFNVAMTVSPLDFSVGEQVSALADTGASCSKVPASLLMRLGIAPAQTIEFELANGAVVEYPTGWAGFAAAGQTGIARVIFGEDDECLLGATTLEDLGLMVDPVNYRLVPTRRLLKPELHTNGQRPQ